MTRESFARVVVGVVVVLAGCAGPAIDSSTTTIEQSPPTTPGGVDTTGEMTTTTTPAQTTLTTASREPFPDPPSNLTAAAVTRTVRQYDETRIHNVLRTRYRDFSVGFWRPTNATVFNRTGRGVYATVTTTYSYQYEAGYVDGLEATSLYFVNTTVVKRVNGTELQLL